VARSGTQAKNDNRQVVEKMVASEPRRPITDLRPISRFWIVSGLPVTREFDFWAAGRDRPNRVPPGRKPVGPSHGFHQGRA
jgi:hypothetical protein